MRFGRYLDGGLKTEGVVDGDEIIPLTDGGTLLEIIREGGLPGLLAAGERALSSPLRQASATPVAEVRLLPPICPPSIRDFSAFEEHVEGVVKNGGPGVVPPEWYEAPAFYFSNPHSLIGAHDDVPIPAGCELFDFELEVAAILGVALTDPSPDEAAAAIIGYTIFNDWSARDIQLREMRVNLGPAKGKDFASTLGPWLVTADELADRTDESGRLDLEMSVEVNGRLIGRDRLSNMAWTFGELASYSGRNTTLFTGDLIGSGTCGGGCLLELWGRNGEHTPPPLRPGDVVTMTVERLGTISNTVVPGHAVHDIPSARSRVRPAGFAG